MAPSVSSGKVLLPAPNLFENHALNWGRTAIVRAAGWDWASKTPPWAMTAIPAFNIPLREEFESFVATQRPLRLIIAPRSEPSSVEITLLIQHNGRHLPRRYREVIECMSAPTATEQTLLLHQPV